MKKDFRIAVIGLGYVGLPLATAFGKEFCTIGFDINEERVSQLNKKVDVTDEVTYEELSKANKLSFTCDENKLKKCNVFIVTVPTPINTNKEPDLSFLKEATLLISKYLKKDDLVVYESTVFPGVTDDFCGKILSDITSLQPDKDFSLGYSPERINPGDKNKRLKDIVKVISASNAKALEDMKFMYEKIIEAGIYSAETIKTAEAAKVIENTQRDVNIGLINEFSKIFKKLDIDTNAVLEAASTKWNFINLKPGLVGGHCIGIDPYYLAHIAKENDVEPRLILSARETNDDMSHYCAELVHNSLKEQKIHNAKILILGATFKENCPDFRNTKIIDLFNSLQEFGHLVQLSDFKVNAEKFFNEYKVKINNNFSDNKYDAVILAVPHEEYVDKDYEYFDNLKSEKGLLFDLKGIFPKEKSNLRL